MLVSAFCTNLTTLQAGVKEQLTADATKKLREGVSQEELIEMVREVQVENKIPESQIARLVDVSRLVTPLFSLDLRLLFHSPLTPLFCTS